MTRSLWERLRHVKGEDVLSGLLVVFIIIALFVIF